MIQLENICKQYTNHNHTVRAVDDVSFSVAENERVGIAGGSGSGKSTLLRMIAMLEKPTSGTCLLYTSPSPRDVEESRMPSSA